MRRLPLLFPLLLVLALVGCRDALVDPGAEPIDEPPPDVTDSPTMYLKGPSEMTTGQLAAFRAELIPSAVVYRWYALTDDSAQVTGAPEAGTTRIYNIRAVEAGEVELRVQALDEENQTVGVGTKTVHIVSP